MSNAVRDSFPAPSHRLKDLGEYYFSRKLQDIAKRNQSGADVINLGIGSPDTMPHASVISRAQQVLQQSNAHGYSAHRSSPELRKAMADWYQKIFHVSVDADREVLPLLGSKEAVSYLSLAYLNPGDEVLVPNPGYPAYRAGALLAGATVKYYNLSAENGWQPAWDDIEASDLSRVKLMWLNYPHMPTGTDAQNSTFQKAIEFAHKHKILICHDNPYALILNHEAPRSIWQFDSAHQYSLELNSLSKSHAMAGWRVGMMLAAPAVIQAVLQVKTQIDSGMFAVVQAAASEALSLPASWYESHNATYRERRRLVEKILKELRCDYDPKQIGLFMWAKLPQSHSSRAEDFADRILDQCRVFLAPGTVFGSQGEGYIRISLCAPAIRIQEALQRIQEGFSQ